MSKCQTVNQLSENIFQKDSEILDLQKENQKLKDKVRRLEKRVSKLLRTIQLDEQEMEKLDVEADTKTVLKQSISKAPTCPHDHNKLQLHTFGTQKVWMCSKYGCLYRKKDE